MKPVRLQLSRKRGFNLQALSLATNGLPAVNVARPSVFGNQFICTRFSHCTRSGVDMDEGYCCCDAFEEYARSGVENRPACTGTVRGAVLALTGYVDRTKMVKRLPELTNKNLACWCGIADQHGNYVPCHADVLLSIVNDIPMEEVIRENTRRANL